MLRKSGHLLRIENRCGYGGLSIVRHDAVQMYEYFFRLFALGNTIKMRQARGDNNGTLPRASNLGIGAIIFSVLTVNGYYHLAETTETSNSR